MKRADIGMREKERDLGKREKETGLGAEQGKVECLSRSDGQMRIETEGRTEKARGIDTKRGTE